MSNELSIPRQDQRSGDAVTLDWGSDRPAGRDGLGRLVDLARRDHRLPRILGGLGAVAGFGSLVGHWTVATIPNTGSDNDAPVRLPAGVSEVGNFGVTYLLALFGLLGCLSLVLFGSAAIRRNARVLGLAFAGALLAVLVAAAASLDEATSRRFFLGTPEGFQVVYGRGLGLAFVTAGLLGLALLVAGPAGPTPAGPAPGGADAGQDGYGSDHDHPNPGPGPDGPNGGRSDPGTTPAGGGRTGPRSRWSGWLGRGRPADERGPDARPAPADLTVSAAPPIITPQRSTDD